MNTKRCPRCQTEKPLSGFWIIKGKPHVYCKKCANEYRNKWYRTERGRAHQHGQALLPSKRFALAKYAAKKRGLAFTVSKAQFLELITKPCVYCGSVLDKTGSSMDRVDNGKGYLVDNVAPACGVCNNIKGELFTFDEMKRVGKIIAEVRKKRPLSIARGGRPTTPLTTTPSPSLTTTTR